MGLFHCPIGAAGYGGEGCIQCGLCSAASREEKIAATEKIRTWIRENAHLRNADLKIKKIAVCGKGGSGKSTASALLSGALERLGYQILVMDTDSSNSGLWRKLGMHAPPPALSNASEERAGDLAFLQKDPLYFSDLGAPYLVKNGGRMLMCAGKVEDPLLGCACSVAAFAKMVMENLTPGPREIILADQEAGLESFGRGIEQGCDTVLILVEPSSESIELAGKIQYMAQGLGIRRVRAILNRIEEVDQEEFVMEALSGMGVRYLGALPLMKEIRNQNMRGMELTPELSCRLMGTIAKYLLDEAEMPYDKVR